LLKAKAFAIFTAMFKPGVGKLIWRMVKYAMLVFFGLSIFWVLLYRFVNPPVTWLMVSRGFERKADGKPWKIETTQLTP
jgi:monofunctional biosynthetic peptidoglycan transglycosylase